MKRVCCLIILIAISHIVFAQNGKITGKVISASSGQPLAGATLTVIEKNKTKAADQNGMFTFSKLEAGTYSIKCSYTGYDSKIIEEIIVKDNENADISISLDIKASDVVIVTAPKRLKAAGATIESLLIAQKNSANIGDGVSEQSLKRTPARTASDAIKLVSGASIQDDRFAVIRGLNDRYNAAFINGTPLPSTESDRKAFSFDIFPSAILDNLIIYKTATPDKTGDFVGGIIDITTKGTTSQNFNTISFGTSYNSLLTGKPRFYSENKSKTDFLGVDDGLRGIPEGLPENIGTATGVEKAEYAKLFKNYKWGVRQMIAKPNFNFQFSKGINFQRKEKEFLSALFSINYSKNYTFNVGNRDQFTPDKKIQLIQLNDSIYNEEIILSALGNFSIKINANNTISWKNNYSVNTDNRLIKRRNTPDLQADPNSALRDIVRSYTSNQIYSSQLIGEHLIGNKKTKINWLGAFTKVIRDIPNFSRTSYQYDPTVPDVGVGNALVTASLSQTFGSGTMLFIKSNESIKSIKLEITQPYTLMKNAQSFKIGAGYLLRERNFSSRLLGFAPYEGGGVMHDNSLTQLPEDQIFLAQHLGLKKSGIGGFTLNETNPSFNNYDASSSTKHAFIMNDQRFFKNFRFIYGVRMEQFNQKLTSPYGFNSIVPPTIIDSTITDFLPSINFVYALTKKMNIRLSYAETVNRPEFRELAPVVFYDYAQQYAVNGDPKVQRAKIRNYDFRYEFFPGKAQLFSISVFYKEFKNPIEFMFIPSLLGSQGFYGNTTSAKVKGVEAEFRTMLSTFLGIKRENSFLNKLTLSANAAIIQSNVQILDTINSIPPNELRNNDALQGQSPYIINGSLNFNDDKLGISTTLSANRIGDRILVKGSIGFGGVAPVFNIVEKGRTVIDFQIAKLFLKNKLELKINVKDLLAQDFLLYSDVNEESKSYNEEKDLIFSVYKAPTTISVGVTYKF
jgi:TonB dependent receptor/CarboxypepD_reg-like domain/TonB-dependent Receptor Plug Domain